MVNLTASVVCPHNRAVLRPVSQVAVASVSMLAILLSMMLPPEHVHVSTATGHPGAAHRHTNFHAENATHPDLVAHLEASDDDDAHVVWVATSVTERQVPSTELVSVDVKSLVPSLTAAALPGRYSSVPGHDPPCSLPDPRGPPELASV